MKRFEKMRKDTGGKPRKNEKNEKIRKDTKSYEKV